MMQVSQLQCKLYIIKLKNRTLTILKRSAKEFQILAISLSLFPASKCWLKIKAATKLYARPKPDPKKDTNRIAKECCLKRGATGIRNIKTPEIMELINRSRLGYFDGLKRRKIGGKHFVNELAPFKIPESSTKHQVILLQYELPHSWVL